MLPGSLRMREDAISDIHVPSSAGWDAACALPAEETGQILLLATQG